MPVTDRRDMILDRLATILTGLTSTVSLTGTNGTPSTLKEGGFVQNRNELPDGLTPGIILMDGDELQGMKTVIPGRTPPRIAPQIMKIVPEIYVVLDVRKPNNVNVREDLSICRLAILSAIYNDKMLLDLVSTNGRVEVEAIVTDLARNRPMKGQMGLSIAFYYPLIPGEIVG